MVEREASDKENVTGKQKRRTVTYDKGKILAALLESTQDLQSDKGLRSSHARKRIKRMRGHPQSNGVLSPVEGGRRGRRVIRTRKERSPLAHHPHRVARTRVKALHRSTVRIIHLSTLLLSPREEATIPIVIVGLDKSRKI